MFTAICKRIGVWVVQKGRFYLLLGVLCLLGSVTLTANAILTVSNSGMFGDADVTVDSAGTLNVGTASSTAVVIGKTGTPVTIPGNVAINGTLTLGSASTTGQLIFRIASSSFTTLLQASSSQASNFTFTLPTTAGTAGQAMLTDGAGNLFFGNISSSQWLNGTSGTISYSSGSIGINTTTPLALLSIVGSSTPTAPLFDIASSTGASLFRVSPNGNVTVGTTVLPSGAPAGSLAVAGNVYGTVNAGHGNRVVGLGDSITSWNDTDTNRGGSYISYLSSISNGAIDIVHNAGVSGQTSTQALASIPTAVIPYAPAKCFILIGTNDTTGAGWQALLESNLNAMVSELRAANIEPVLFTLSPRNDVPTFPSQANVVVREVALRNNVRLVDFYAATVNPPDGHWQSGMSSDGTHPLPPGWAAMATAAWSVLSPEFSLWSPPRPLDAVDGANLISNGLFLTGTGIATGWSNYFGGGTYALNAVSSGYLGANWQTVTRGSGDTGSIGLGGPSFTVIPGHRVAVSCRMTASAGITYSIFTSSSKLNLLPIHSWTW